MADTSSFWPRKSTLKPAQTFTCKYCGKTYKSKSGFLTHINKHKGIRFKCQHCVKSFTQISSRNAHKRRVHQNIKPYPCDECNKRFTTRYSLKLHQKIHSNDKAFICRFCKKSFVQKVNLETHSKVHYRKPPKPDKGSEYWMTVNSKCQVLDADTNVWENAIVKYRKKVNNIRTFTIEYTLGHKYNKSKQVTLPWNSDKIKRS